MPRLGIRQIQALEAVAAGRIQHVHPSAWAIPVEFYDVMPYARWFNLLNGLARMVLIRIEATSKNYFRPVIITEAGQRAYQQRTLRAGYNEAGQDERQGLLLGALMASNARQHHQQTIVSPESI